MTPWQQLELCINKIEAQAETTAILIKEAQSAAATALAYHEQQLEALEQS